MRIAAVAVVERNTVEDFVAAVAVVGVDLVAVDGRLVVIVMIRHSIVCAYLSARTRMDYLDFQLDLNRPSIKSVEKSKNTLSPFER